MVKRTRESIIQHRASLWAVNWGAVGGTAIMGSGCGGPGKKEAETWLARCRRLQLFCPMFNEIGKWGGGRNLNRRRTSDRRRRTVCGKGRHQKKPGSLGTEALVAHKVTTEKKSNSDTSLQKWARGRRKVEKILGRQFTVWTETVVIRGRASGPSWGECSKTATGV